MRLILRVLVTALPIAIVVALLIAIMASRLETARHDPTLSMLEKLAKALRVDVATLLK